MNGMRSLRDLYAYNAWGNGEVFGVCRSLDRSQLEGDAPGTVGTIENTLKHLVVVEDAYLQMLSGDPLWNGEQREEYGRHDLTWFEQRSEQLGEEYLVLLAGADEDFYDGELKVPWFDFRLTRHDGLLQVLNHSAQHRTQVFSVLRAARLAGCCHCGARRSPPHFGDANSRRVLYASVVRERELGVPIARGGNRESFHPGWPFSLASSR